MTKTPKEFAKDLVDSYIEIMPPLANQTGNSIMAFAKECALKFAEEMLQECTNLDEKLVNWLYKSEKVVFWQSVKSEIEQLIN